MASAARGAALDASVSWSASHCRWRRLDALGGITSLLGAAGSAFGGTALAAAPAAAPRRIAESTDEPVAQARHDDDTMLAAGFGLYLSRRVHLEAWDLELGFKRMAARAVAAGRGAGGVLVLLLAVLAMPTSLDAKEKVAKSLDLPERATRLPEGFADLHPCRCGLGLGADHGHVKAVVLFPCEAFHNRGTLAPCANDGFLKGTGCAGFKVRKGIS
jgi:hypothetical protein